MMLAPQDRGGESEAWHLIAAIALVSAATLISFLGSLDNEFVNWDDGIYVTDNRLIQHLSWDSLAKIFSYPRMKTYVPFSSVSLAIDYKLWGLDPFGYHLTNLLLHLINTLLVFCLVRRLAHQLIPALIAALLFGVHPIHVESVAWISERKDVLSTLFFLSALLFYLRYRAGQRSLFYILSLASFVVALLSKQMAITLPIVMVLCDFLEGRSWTWRVLTEKMPFLVLSLVFGLGAYLLDQFQWWPQVLEPASSVSQGNRAHSPREIIEGFDELSSPEPHSPSRTEEARRQGDQQLHDSHPAKPTDRENVLARALRDHSKWTRPGFLKEQFLLVCWGLVYPLGTSLMLAPLSIIHIAPPGAAFLQPTFLLSLLFVAALTTGVWISRRYTRAIVFGSLFFLFTLLPTFKFLPFQADRYLYIPSIGLCYLAGLAFGWLYAQSRGIGRGLLVASVSVLIALLGFSTWQRCEVWQDSESLWSSVVKNYSAYPAVQINLGHAYWSKGRLDAAIGAYHKALDLQPDQVETLNNLGTAHAQKGELDAALRFYNRALAVKPDYVEAQGNLGSVYLKQGRLDEALSIYQEALARRPGNPEILHNTGIAWHKKGDLKRAISYYERALLRNPHQAPFYNNLAFALHGLGERAKALEVLERAQRHFPGEQTPSKVLGRWDQESAHPSSTP